MPDTIAGRRSQLTNVNDIDDASNLEWGTRSENVNLENDNSAHKFLKAAPGGGLNA